MTYLFFFSKSFVLSTLGFTCVASTLYDKVCQWFVKGQWFSLGPPVSSTNKTDHHNITEILLKVALNTIMTYLFFFSKSFVLSTLGFTCVAFVTGALALWAPLFMQRSINVQSRNVERLNYPFQSIKVT
jgi:protein-S-isoprenylcysteine O-methyltransferase Ste14